MILPGIIVRLLKIITKKVMGKFMEKILLKIAEKIVEQLSPVMRDAIDNGVRDLEKKAKDTPNP